MVLTLSFIIWFLVGSICGYYALNRGRDPYIWFAIGIFFGIFGVIALFLLPPLESKEENGNGNDSSGAEGSIDETPVVMPPLPMTIPIPTISIEEEYMAKQWFYIIPASQRQGPISFLNLKDLWKDEKINSETFVWSEGMKEWSRISDLLLLKNMLG